MKKLSGKLIVFMLIVVAAIACTMTACGDKGNSTPTEGPETGSYYCEAGSDTEYLLTLSGGKTVKLNMGQELTGEYTVSGSALSFKFGEQSMTATFGGDVITLTVTSAGGVLNL